MPDNRAVAANGMLFLRNADIKGSQKDHFQEVVDLMGQLADNTLVAVPPSMVMSAAAEEAAKADRAGVLAKLAEVAGQQLDLLAAFRDVANPKDKNPGV